MSSTVEEEAFVSPSLKNIRAVVTSQWGRSYRPRVIRNIENYYVDTALDNDADPFMLEIGDPRGELLDVLRRDSEIRVEIYGTGPNAAVLPQFTGFADEATYSEQGTLTFMGRDYSAVATDSIVPPQQFRQVRAWSVVKRQAEELGFKSTSLTREGIVKKVQYTDGSESYWEFWHRLYRKEKMWIWTEANGTLVAGRLNYTSPPSYYFGVPRKTDPTNLRGLYLPVERVEIRKTLQDRVGEVWVYGHKGDNGFRVVQFDPTTRAWVKRPRRIMLDTESHTPTAAIKTAWEEIFEGKVGSVEVKLTIADPGFTVRQNQIARVNLPDQGISGDFFVVGTRCQVNADGFIQEVRLRERQYAISRRVPTEIKPRNKTEATRGETTVESETTISTVADNMPEEWGAYFVKAAQKWHGPWDYDLFLATLIAIAHQETGGSFTNIRRNGGPGGSHIEWYPWEAPGGSQSAGDTPARGGRSPVPRSHGRTLEEWRTIFANEKGDGYVTEDYAVGPMQLYSMGYKHFADDLLKPNYHDEWYGGRWHPEHNIMAGAFALRDKLKAMVGDSGRDIDMWAGVSAYGHHYAGEGPNTIPTRYAVSVKNMVYNSPGYLDLVKQAISSARDTAAAPKPVFDPGDSNGKGFSNSQASLAKLTGLRARDSTVDLVHVDWRLLSALNSLAISTGYTITITSGFRTYEEQLRLWKRYVHNGYDRRYIAANPDKAPSNHQLGRACDCYIGSQPLSEVLSGATLARFGLHYSVPGDRPHVTLIGVTG